MWPRLQMVALLTPILIGTFAGGFTAMAQTSEDLQKQIDQLKLEKEKLDAEKAKLDSQKALADAQKALADSQKALEQAKSSSGKQLTDLQSQKALSDAQKALAEAQTQAALSKYIGDVKAGAYSGTVDMKEKAGTEEALLLSSRAVQESSAKIAKAIATGEQSRQLQKIYIFGSKEFPTFQRLLTFRFQKELIKQAFKAAGVMKPEGEEGRKEVPALAVASAGLDAFSKILGFFKTDYTVGGIEVKLDESLLLFSVAGGLKKQGKEVHLPLVYEPNTQGSTVEELTKALADLVDLRSRAVAASNQMKDAIADNEKKAAAPNLDPATKDALLATAAALKAKVDQLKGVIALYDSFVESLTTPDSNATVPLMAIAREYSIAAALEDHGKGSAVLLLRLENSGGGYLLKKNLLTALWKMPLYHMGGATVAYLLLSGPDGQVLAGDIIPMYGGFVKTDHLRKKLETQIK